MSKIKKSKVLKRSLSVLLAVCIAFSSGYVGFNELDFSGVFAVGASATSSGTCGTNLTWTLDDNGTLTISGTGVMNSFESYDLFPWYDVHANIKSVVINDGVTNIGNYAFENCEGLTSATILDSVTTIGVNAFYNCASDFIIYCFRDSYAMQYAIDNSYEYVIIDIAGTENSTIDYNNNLVFTTLNCSTSLDDIICTPINISASVQASLLSADKEYLGTGSVITVVDAEDVSTDYVLVVEGDINSDSVCDVVDAAEAALFSTELKKPSVNQIYAGNGCISDSFDILSYQNVVNQVLSNSTKPSSPTPSVTILDEGQCGDNLYWQMKSDGELRIYGSGEMYDYVKSITPSPWYKYREEPYITEDDNSILNSDGTYYDSTSRYYSDNPNNWRIKRIVIEEGVTYIGNWAFYRVCVDELTIPEGVEEIGYFAIRFSPNIKKVNLPDSLRVLGDYAISRNYELTTVNIGNQLVRAGRGCFKSDTSLTEVILPDTCVSINEVLSDDSKYGVNLSDNNVGFLEYCSSLKTVDFGSVDKIPYNTCVRTDIESVVIPNSVKSIDSQAFYSCESLQSVVFEEGSTCTSIASNAFSGCSSLERVVGGTALKTMGSYTLLPLKEFDFSETNTSLSNNQFNGTLIKTASVSNNISTIPLSWMSNNTALETLYISSSVKEIKSAFTGCTSLGKIYYDGTSEEWEGITKTSGWNYRVPSTCEIFFSDGSSELLKNTL